MRSLVQIAGLAVIAVSLQGCAELLAALVQQAKALYQHVQVANAACLEDIKNGTASLSDKAIANFTAYCSSGNSSVCTADWNITGPACINQFYDAFTQFTSLTDCVVELLQLANLSKGEPNQTLKDAQAAEWYAANKEKVEANLTLWLSSAVLDCANGTAPNESLEEAITVQQEFLNNPEKYMVGNREMTKKADVTAYISAAGVGMIMAVVAGVIHRRTSKVSVPSVVNSNVEAGHLLDDFENAD